MTHEALIAEAESFAAGCSRDRLELRLVDALKAAEETIESLTYSLKPDQCYFCDQVVPVEWTVDPYAEELFGDITHYWICDGCWDERAA